MNVNRYVLKSIRGYKKQHLAILSGIILFTMILSGALMIGDSVKDSLKNLINLRLGNTKYVLVSGTRFVRSSLGNEIASKLQVNSSSVFLFRGMAINPDSGLRINQVQVTGIDSSFWTFTNQSFPELLPDEAILGENVAQRLKLKVGDELLLRLENATIIPVNAPFSPETKPTVATRLKIKRIVNDESFARFSLMNSQSAPFNVFVSRKFLSEKLNLPNLCNAILFNGNKLEELPKSELDQVLAQNWQPEDAGLFLSSKQNNYFEITSNRVFIDKPLSESLLSLPYRPSPVLTYLVNDFQFGNKSTPYSFVSALPNENGSLLKNEDDILINKWLAEDLGISTGDSMTLKYYIIGPLRNLSEKSRRFKVEQILPVESAGIDRSLMPSFPGLSDAGSCKDWNTGIPIDLKRIRDKDEKYWNDFRGTPKAAISFRTGKAMWDNAFGYTTAIRFTQDGLTVDSLKKAIMQKIRPSDIGLSFRAVNNEATFSASNGVDFGELFLSLSFFIISAAIMLMVLLFILHLESRSIEAGTLSALGFERKVIIKMKLMEMLPIAFFGGIIGAFAGYGYQFIMLLGLNTLWNDAVHSDALKPVMHWSTLAIGIFSGVFLSLGSVFWATKKWVQQNIASTLRKIRDRKIKNGIKRVNKLKILVLICLPGALVLMLLSLISSSFFAPSVFLTAGALFLIGGTSLLFWLIPVIHQFKKKGDLTWWVMAITNTSRKKGRSATVVLVLSIGVFSIVLTGSYRRTFSETDNISSSGTGGFRYWVETAIPVINDLNKPEGRKQLVYEQDKDMEGVRFMQIPSLDGDDASCLNLNQVLRPRILGIPTASFDQRKAFTFLSLKKELSVDHPWLELNRAYGINIFPAFADETVIQYGLKKQLGDTLKYIGETGDTIMFVLAGALDNSIFQGNLLISDKVFGDLYPSHGGTKLALVDCDWSQKEKIKEVIQNSFNDMGVEITSTTERLAAFNSVENTYLSVFMALGALGIIIGTIGLAIILYRNMLERQQEFGVFLAIGFEKRFLFKIIFFENFFLFSSAVVLGGVSALIGILPSLFTASFTVNKAFLLGFIILTFLLGMVWIWLLTRKALKNNLVTLLRNE